MSIVGIAASKDYLYLAMTTTAKEAFAVLKHHRIVVDSSDWPSLMRDLTSILGSYNAEDAIDRVAIVECSSGKFGASPDAFKSEGFAELKCQELGYPISHITKNSLPKLLACSSGQKWQAAAKEMFNSRKSITYFSQGFDAAVSGAHGVAQ